MIPKEKERKQIPEPIPNHGRYCMVCEDLYDDYYDHIKSDEHRRFHVNYAQPYNWIDGLIQDFDSRRKDQEAYKANEDKKRLERVKPFSD